MEKKNVLTVLFGVWAAGALLAAPSGSCEKEAVSLSGTRSFILTNEYVDGVRQTNGVYYFKATLNRGNAYTVFTDGVAATATVTLLPYAAESTKDDVFEPSADFEELDERGMNQRYVMYADDWYIDDEDPSESDPKSWTYYFLVQGAVGETGTIGFVSGVNIPLGRSSNQQSITPQTTPVAVTNKKLEINGEYYFKARLQAGRLYHFATTGGTEETALSLSVESYSDDDDLAVPALYDDPAYDESNDSGLYVVPAETGMYTILVAGLTSEDDQKPFGLTHVLYGARTPAQHPVLELNASNGYAANFKAGRLVAPGSPFYDEIIDEGLCAMTVAKGARLVASTTGATTNLLMRVYDAKGTVLAENTADGNIGYDVRTAFTASAAGTYYIGVCQNLDKPIIEAAAYTPVSLQVEDATAVNGQPDRWERADDVVATATPLSALPGPASQRPEEIDSEGNGWHQLGKTDWQDTFVLGGRKDVTYRISATVEDPTATKNHLMVEVFTLSGTKELPVSVAGGIDPSSSRPLTFTSKVNQPYYIRVWVEEGQGLDFPNYKLHATAYQEGAASLNVLTVNTHGAAATWTLDTETVKYSGGTSILVSGEHTVKFGVMAGFVAPAAQKVNPVSGAVPTVVDAYYTDTFDPKDNTAAGATAWALKNVPQTIMRTLWKEDPEDNLSIVGADGYYYDFALETEDCEAVFSITNALHGVLVENVTSVTQLQLPKTMPKYYLVVKPADGATLFGGYRLTGSFANVGSIKLAKTAVTVKENAPNVTVTVNRTAKDGVVRVQYGTVAGTAKPGVDYVPQSGVLEWGANDMKPKTVTIPLIPDVVEVYEGNKTFAFKVKPIDEIDLTPNEYPAAIIGGDTCTITLTEAARAGTTVASIYAAKAPKLATVKTETVPLETGTFTALLKEDGIALTNGLPQIASLTLTASTATPAALSAKVMLAGKTYTFAGKGWEPGEDEKMVRKELQLVQKVNNVMYTNTLMVTVNAGRTETAGDWLRAGGEVELTMNVPDANLKGVQEEIRYTGELFRNNAKIQDYLTAVTNFTGYYTLALDSGATVAEGLPAGNGYLTLTIDNKGTAKVAGQLADGLTKPSLSVAACAIRPYGELANGYALEIPVFFAKSPACFGGVLRLTAIDDPEQPSGALTRVVVDASRTLIWNNDDPATTYANEEGYRFDNVIPCGGWYDTVVNLQAYYLNYALSVGTADISEFPTEPLTSGYVYATVQPDGFAQSFSGNALVTTKKTLVKSGTLVDLEQSINPCNVQVKVARATGLVTGSCSLWSESEDGLKQKEMTGLKVFGVVVLGRDPYASLTEEIIAPGFVTQNVKLTDYNETTKRTTTRNWTFSAPFNLVGEDQGDVDWWAEDWGSEFNED